ncbi:MAG: hypothetical protein EBZ77_16745, partial [Chitinophagia bacterium]|nr:hypothetical protein [Chitinophagia bacterium]
MGSNYQGLRYLRLSSAVFLCAAISFLPPNFGNASPPPLTYTIIEVNEKNFNEVLATMHPQPAGYTPGYTKSCECKDYRLGVGDRIIVRV